MPENMYDEDLFNDHRDNKNDYSTFIQQLEESTQKLMNQVFNSQYIPDIHEADVLEYQAQKKKQNNNIKSFNASRKNLKTNQFNSSKRTVVTKCSSERQLSESFVNFLNRNEKWKKRKLQRVDKQLSKKQQDELKGLSFIPTILRASKQKLQPIYERCLDLQQQKQKKLALKRMQKQRNESEKEGQYSYKPEVNRKTKNRSFNEYLKDKQQWSSKRQQFIENSKIIRDAQKYEQCLFHPVLISKYSKLNPQKRQGQKVQDRLLRSLQKSIQKKEAKKKGK